MNGYTSRSTLIREAERQLRRRQAREAGYKALAVCAAFIALFLGGLFLQQFLEMFA